MEDLIEAESKRSGVTIDDSLNAIKHARSITSDEANDIEAEAPLKPDVVPTFTVDEDGVLNIPTTPASASPAEIDYQNEIVPTQPAHRDFDDRGNYYQLIFSSSFSLSA